MLLVSVALGGRTNLATSLQGYNALVVPEISLGNESGIHDLPRMV